MSNQLPITALRVNYAIGIDPDLGKSGLAVWSRQQGRHTYISSVGAFELISLLNQVKSGEALFFVDAGWLNGGYFHYANFPDGFDKWNVKAQYAYLVKRGINVGENFGVGKFIIDYLIEVHGVDNVRLIRPVDEKWDATKLKQLTGWTKRTNPDSRDAARLCWKRI